MSSLYSFLRSKQKFGLSCLASLIIAMTAGIANRSELRAPDKIIHYFTDFIGNWEVRLEDTVYAVKLLLVVNLSRGILSLFTLKLSQKKYRYEKKRFSWMFGFQVCAMLFALVAIYTCQIRLQSNSFFKAQECMLIVMSLLAIGALNSEILYEIKT